jgi:hypothetical protein
MFRLHCVDEHEHETMCIYRSSMEFQLHSGNRELPLPDAPIVSRSMIMSHSLDIMRQAVLKLIVVVVGARTFTPTYG